jgi:hypothetical protein
LPVALLTLMLSICFSTNEVSIDSNLVMFWDYFTLECSWFTAQLSFPMYLATLTKKSLNVSATLCWSFTILSSSVKMILFSK